MLSALFPGSFDPITNGHVRLIERAAALLPAVIVVVSYNPAKQGFLPLAQRLTVTRTVLAPLPNVSVLASERELLVDLARRVGSRLVVRGLRDGADFRHEYEMAMMNRAMYPALDTLFLVAEPESAGISSSAVRALLAAGRPIDPYVPAEVVALLGEP